MGLASSQARLLNLTSRMHQIEYKAAKVEAEKLQMANESDRVYNEYLDALEATKVQRKQLTATGAVTYVDVNSLADFAAVGVYLCKVNTDGTYTTCDPSAATVTLNDSTVVTISAEAITNLINSGEFVLVTAQTNTPTADDFTSISTNTNLQEVQDETMLRIAEAKYEADMRKIDKKERKYDAELATFDNERNAIKSEIDTLKTVAKENVDRTFKIFS